MIEILWTLATVVIVLFARFLPDTEVGRIHTPWMKIGVGDSERARITAIRVGTKASFEEMNVATSQYSKDEDVLVQCTFSGSTFPDDPSAMLVHQKSLVNEILTLVQGKMKERAKKNRPKGEEDGDFDVYDMAHFNGILVEFENTPMTNLGGDHVGSRYTLIPAHGTVHTPLDENQTTLEV